VPSTALSDSIAAANEAATTAHQRKVDMATKKAYYDTVKERIKFASEIKTRQFEALREEERIIIYRRLIASLLTSTKIKNPSKSTQHIIAEMINSIFDVDKMLYFVAPDWWRPKFKDPNDPNKDYYHNQQSIGNNPALNDSMNAWGGSNRDTNYLITEESNPAKLGSPLGWLMQLDGDNLRNAFLNAPWVKAVIPIRPGKEEAAIHWLKAIEMEGEVKTDALPLNVEKKHC
jgi:hypothetical protein